MTAMLSLMSVASGTYVACYADCIPGKTARVEFWGGALLVLGFALIGTGLPLFR